MQKFSAGIFLFLFILSFSGYALAAPEYSASLASVKVDTNLTSGRKFSLEVKITNNGVKTLSGANGVYLYLSSNSTDWSSQKVSLGNFELATGQSKKLRLTLNAPSRNGIYNLAWVLKKGDVEISNRTALKQYTVETRSNKVKFISQVVPENMKTGEENLVIVQFRNEGSHVWTRKDNFRLGFYGPDKKAWNTRTIKLNENDVVPPGEVASFRFDLKAPSKAGLYQLQWRMLKGSNRWMGEPTPALMINVNQGNSELDAEFMHQTLPGLQNANVSYSILERGRVYPVTMTLRNNGSQPWLPGIYSLVSRVEKSDLVWSVSKVNLKPNEVIKPGQIKSFTFQIFAPLEPGIYDFQWQMRKGSNTWLGDKSEKITITVK